MSQSGTRQSFNQHKSTRIGVVAAAVSAANPFSLATSCNAESLESPTQEPLETVLRFLFDL